MANEVRDIVDGAEAIALSVLGDWTKLRFVQDLSRNDGRSAGSAYGVRPAEAEPGPSVTKSETLRHTFVLILSKVLARYDSDDESQAVLDTLYEKAAQIFKQYVTRKMDLPLVVLQVEDRSMEAPIVDKSGVVYLEIRFVVRYRQAL